MAEKQKNGKIEAALDLVKEIIFFLLLTAAMLAYCLLVLLIISFVTSSSEPLRERWHWMYTMWESGSGSAGEIRDCFWGGSRWKCRKQKYGQ